MNASRDPDRLIKAFLLEGPDRLHDQVYDAVRADVDMKRQRVVIGPWRLPTMNKLAPIGLGTAAVVAVLLLGSRLFGAPVSPGGPGATPDRTDTALPTSAPVATLPLGPYLVKDTGAFPNTPSITVTIPAPGWAPLPAYGGLTKGPDTDPPQAAMLLWAFPARTGLDVYGDPCQWKSTTPDKPATTVEEIAAALAAQQGRDASVPVDVTVTSGAPGKLVRLHVPNDAVFADCDDGVFATYGIAGTMAPNRSQQAPGQVDELWILNVNDTVVIIDAMYRADTPAALIDEMRAIAESARFAW
jgi:hypothetical protein